MDRSDYFKLREALEELEECQGELQKTGALDEASREACLEYVSSAVRILDRIVKEYLHD